MRILVFFQVFLITSFCIGCGRMDKRSSGANQAAAKFELSCADESCLPQAGLIIGSFDRQIWTCTGFVVLDNRKQRVVQLEESCLKPLIRAGRGCMGRLVLKLPNIERIFQCRDYIHSHQDLYFVEFGPKLVVEPLGRNSEWLKPHGGVRAFSYQTQDTGKTRFLSRNGDSYTHYKPPSLTAIPRGYSPAVENEAPSTTASGLPIFDSKNALGRMEAALRGAQEELNLTTPFLWGFAQKNLQTGHVLTTLVPNCIKKAEKELIGKRGLAGDQTKALFQHFLQFSVPTYLLVVQEFKTQAHYVLQFHPDIKAEVAVSETAGRGTSITMYKHGPANRVLRYHEDDLQLCQDLGVTN